MPQSAQRKWQLTLKKPDLERIFYPAVDEIYSNPANKTSWVAVLVDDNKSRPTWVFSCLEAWKGIANNQDIDPRKKLEIFRILGWYSSLYRNKDMEPFSQMIFSESYISQPVIFTSDGSLESEYRVLVIDIMKRLPRFIPADFSVSEFDRPGLHKYLKNISKKILREYDKSIASFISDIQRKLRIRRNIDPEKLIHFILWLYLHDPDGKYWIYLPYPRKLSEGSAWGGVMICQKRLPNDERLRKYQDLTSLCFEVCAYDPCFRGKEISFADALTRAMWVSDRMFLKHRREIEACIRNFEMQELRERLIELENMMILKPLSWASFFEKNIRWISAFGWHTLTNDLYRIGWDFCPGRVPKTPGAWRNAEKSKERFGILAGLFQALLNKREIFSIGDLLFTKCDRKRPIVISYDLAEADLLSKRGLSRLGEKQDFVFLTLRSFYDPIKDKLDEIPVDEMITPEKFEEEIRAHLGRFMITTMAALDSEVFSELERLKPRITKEEKEAILKQMTLYFPWLVLHDLKTRFVVYFPSTIKPDIPSGGIMIGFKRPPSAHELVCLQEYVTKIYLMRSYLLSELVPEFPEVLTEAPFARKADSMLKTSKDTRSLVSFAYIDLDNLKDINENYGGHTAGTLALKTLVTLVKEKISREANVDQWALARYGGDEFMLVVLGMRSKDMESLLTEIRNELRVEEKLQKYLKKEMERYEKTYGKLKHFDKRRFMELSKLTFSAGIASSRTHPNYIELRQAADNAEDDAKKSGKDRIEFCRCGCT